MKRILLLLTMFVFTTPLFANIGVWNKVAKEYEPQYNSFLSYYSFVDHFDFVKTASLESPSYFLLAPPLNDDCAGATTLTVNPTFDCAAKASGTFKEATVTTTIVQPTCNPTAKRDVWYKFVATGKIHQLGIDVPGVATWTINVAVYDKADCSLIKAAAFSCFNLTNTAKTSVLTNLVIGRTYYVRLGNTTANDYPFELCLTTAPPPMRISPSGEQYTVEQLIREVLVKSGCNLVSNISYKVGDGSAKTKQYNALGYFNKNGSIFPYEEGIVLTTNDVSFVEGPYKGYSADRGSNNERWGGDKDLNDAIADGGGAPYPQYRSTQIEFEFIPVKESLQFEYLFTSNSYHQSCGEVCRNGAMFAAWLIDTTTGVGENLAQVPGANPKAPISINTIRNVAKSGASCASANAQHFWKYYDNNQDNPLEAPADYVGFTNPLSSQKVNVVPGRKYRIRLAVIDFCPTVSHTSAAFFNARSFDIGTPTLGDDHVIEGGNALCPGETMVIGTDLDPKDYTIQWTKDGVDLVGENGANLTVTEKGSYGAKLEYKKVTCSLVLEPIRIEYFDDIIIEKVPQNLVQCKGPGATTLFNLEEAVKGVTHYPVVYSFYENQQDAKDDIAAIPPYYSFDNTFNSKTVWVRVQSAISPCFKVFSFTIKTQPCVIGLVPLSPLRICDAPGSTFNLTVYDNIVYHGIPGFKIEYYKSQGNATIELDPIPAAQAAAYNGAHHDMIWVRVTSETDPSLYAITSFELLRDVIPVVNKNVSPLYTCVDVFKPATAFFDLHKKDNEVKQSAGGLVVEYYLSQADADLGDLSKALPKWNYESGEKTVYVRVYSPTSACYSTTTVELKFNIAPVLIGPNEYLICDNLGISKFDLTVIASDQKGVNLKWKHGFFRTYSEASSNTNPIVVKDNIYSNSKPGGEAIYIRVEDELGCVTIKAIELMVKAKPKTTKPADYLICDTNGTGITFFDLTSKQSEILGTLSPSAYDVYYFASNELAMEGNSDLAIKDPANYSNLTGNNVYVRVEDKLSGCYSIEVLRLRTVTLPNVADSVTDYVICDSKSDTGKMKFVLASKKAEITSELSLKISFHESRTDAETGIKPLDENNYVNKDAYSQVVFVRVADVKSGCFKIVSINLIVNKYPPYDMDLGHTITVCTTSNTGIGVFNLIEHGKAHIPSFNNFDFFFFESLENAEKDVNKIVDPEAYSNVKITQTKVWVRIINKTTGCVGIYEIILKVNKAPILLGKIPTQVICDNYEDLFDGKAQFDLTINESSIIKGVVAGHASAVEYYKTKADADNSEKMISGPTNYLTNLPAETIWFKLIDKTTGCSVVGSFDLKVTIGLKLTKPQDLVSCSDLSLGQNNAYFDLTTHKYAIVGGTAVFGTTYFYYETEQDAIDGTNAIATADLTKYKNKSAVQSIWIVVVNEHGCRSMTVQTLIVYAMPNPTMKVTLSICEATIATGSGEFNLDLSASDIINGDTNLNLLYYTTKALAEEGDPAKAITPTDKYVSTSKTIYVRVENKLALISPKCAVIVELKLVVNATPALKDLRPLLACLAEAVPYYEFNLKDKNNEILNGRSAGDYSITYHKAESEARDKKNPLAYNYTNETATSQTIWVRLENIATGCFNVKRLLIQIEQKVEGFDVTPQEYCDDNDKGTPTNDGFTSIDLTVYSLEIIGTQPAAADMSVTYYASQADYDANIPIATPNDFVNTSSPQTIIAVVKNKNKDLYCTAIVELKIVVNKLPEVIVDLEGGYLCKDLVTGQVTPFLIDSKLDSSLYDFIWTFNGSEIPGAKLSYYEAKLAGSYTISTVSKATGCASFNSATVVLTALAPFTVTIDETVGDRDKVSEDGKQTISVNVQDQKTPPGVYEFALNDGPYQNSNVFYDVTAGEHMIWVRDRITGACAVSKLVSVMNYPKFFTPNGDGYNDTWNMRGLSAQPDAKIYIYDRFGKLLKQLSPTGEGWDGTFGGRPVPSTDYWFTVEYNDFQGNRREFKGHFSLKR